MLPISQIRVSKAVLDILKLFVHKGFLGRWINLAYYFENDIPIGSDSTLFHAITAFCFIFLFDRFVVLQWIDVYSFTRATLIETGFYTKTLYGNNQIIISPLEHAHSKRVEQIGLSLQQIYSHFKWKHFDFIVKALVIVKVSQLLFSTKTKLLLQYKVIITTKLLRLHETIIKYNYI